MDRNIPSSSTDRPPQEPGTAVEEQLLHLQQQIQQITRQNAYLHEQLKKQKEDYPPQPEF